MNIDYKSKPELSLEQLLELYHPNMYLVLDDVLANSDTYRIVYQHILDIMKWGFEFEEVRHRIMKFKIHAADKTIHSLYYNNFLSNLILWKAFMELDCTEVMDESYIFEFKMTNLSKIMNYIDDKILSIANTNFDLANKIVDDIIYNMTAIANAFGLLMGMGISIYDIQKTESANPEIGEIMFGKLDPSLQPKEIEDELSRRTDRLIQLFCETDNDLRPLFLSGKNLSKDQVKEIMVMIGLKSDINGNTIAHLIDANILVDGFNKPSHYFISAMSGRKSLILQKTKMGDPGAFSKKINNNTITAILRKDYEQCYSVEPVTYHIKNEAMLKMLDKRNYYDRGEIKELDYRRDKHLIGKIIPFKSPVTCSSEEGICHVCYGSLYEINKDLFSAGGYAATKESEPYGQKVLSSKHSQITVSDAIKLSADFFNIFELSSNEVMLNSTNDDENLSMVFENVTLEDTEDEEFYYVESFNLVDEKANIKYTIKDENETKFYFSKDLIRLYKKGKGKPIPISEFDDDSSVLFNIEVKNKELTKPLDDIQKLLNSKDHFGCRTISEMCQKMMELKIDAGLDFNAVHHEMIIRQLIRKKSNEYEFPDFGPDGDPTDFTILKLNDALFKNPSPTISLSYGYLKKQILSAEFYQKYKPSHIDPLFVEILSKVKPNE